MTMKSRMISIQTAGAFLLLLFVVDARPVVRNIRSPHEFDRLVQKHATETGLPVVVDFYSDSCGPCRMMAPVFKQVAAEYADRAVFVKVDTNHQHGLAARYEVRSLPTFQWIVGGQTTEVQKGAIGEGPLRQLTDKAIREAEFENVELTLDALTEFYKGQDASKTPEDIKSVHQKCADFPKKEFRSPGRCVGSAATQLSRKLRKKYGKAPKTTTRFDPEAAKASAAAEDEKPSSSSSSSRRTAGSSPSASPSTNENDKLKANLHLATREELAKELERRADEERDAAVEAEAPFDEDAPYEEEHKWMQSSFPERVVIVGGGPAGMSAALYAARAGLEPLVLAPSLGGQLQGKGVAVENYPGLLDHPQGPAVIAAMRQQALQFGAFFEDDMVTGIRVPAAGSGPLTVVTNTTGEIPTHTVIVATGADSIWLDVPGEYELRGGGVSSCAICDGALYAGKRVLVVGGGDSAMEDALFLARTSQHVTVIHRRDQFRASKILADRVLQHPNIEVQWNTTVQRILGRSSSSSTDPKKVKAKKNDNDDDDAIDLDDEEQQPVLVNVETDVTEVSGAVLRDVTTGAERNVTCDAVFVAIGHKPNTDFLQGVVEFDPQHPGYILLKEGGISTQTSVPGVFAAGDVADPIYRQAITSAGRGAAAALDAERYLSEHGLGNEAAEFEAELMAELLTAGSGQNDGEKEEETYNVYQEAGGRVHGVKESMAGEL